MLYRKIENTIKNHFKSNSNKILIVDGARQVGKTYIIRHVGKTMFKNFIEINLNEDFNRDKLFSDIKSVNDFYFKLSTIYGNMMDTKENTLIFLDEIQTYPELLTMLKFLNDDNKFTYICSGSLLEVSLSITSSIPIGSIEVIHMYPLDFEEFLLATGMNEFAINCLKESYDKLETLDENMHNKMLDSFKKYLLVGGLPDAVNEYINSSNLFKIRNIQNEIYTYYAEDASKYDKEHKLVIKRIYQMMASTLENKKKRIVYKEIENKNKKVFDNYQNEFEYLTSSGIAIEVDAISTPAFPVKQSLKKNLLKLYFNDIGILTSILYTNNANAILTDKKSINLGTVYENVVATELKAHGFDLYYYDNKSKGEVDFLIDDFNNLKALPIEVKSGKDYTIHRAITTFINNEEYNIDSGIVLSNERTIYKKDGILYLPIYFIMFIRPYKEENVFI